MISEREGNRGDLSRLPLSQISLGVVCPMANEEPTAVKFVREVLAHCASPGFKSVTLFVILDKKKWKSNFTNKWIISGLVIGFVVSRRDVRRGFNLLHGALHILPQRNSPVFALGQQLRNRWIEHGVFCVDLLKPLLENLVAAHKIA